MSFDVTSDGRYVTDFTFGYSLPCTPSGTLTGSVSLLPGARFGILPDGSFPEFKDNPFMLTGSMTGILTVSVGGRFGAPGAAAGTMTLQASITAPAGYQCGPVSDYWSARAG